MLTFKQYLKESDCCSELADSLTKTKATSYDAIDRIMKRIAKKYDITPKMLHNKWMRKYKTNPDDWIKNKLK